MEVTHGNFEESLALFCELLPTASFVAIDCEMTGIRVGQETEPAIGDTCDERYLKMRQVSTLFNLIQVGVCLFHNRDDGKLEVRPFNFYVFPDEQTVAPKGRISMDISTAYFHKKHGLDFNKWIFEGVPYLSAEQADVMRTAAQSEEVVKAARSDDRKAVATREDDKAFIAAALGLVRDWLVMEPVEPGVRSMGKLGDSTITADEIILPPCNGFLRRVLFESIESEHPDLVLESREQENKDAFWKSIAVLRLGGEQKRQRELARRQAKLEAVEARAGFLRVFEAVCRSQKRIVGHNLLYDLMFILNSFVGALPGTLAEFKATLRARLPHIWDTKLLAAACERFPETALKPLYDATRKMDNPVEFEFAEHFDKYHSADKCHEAAYDAFITGVCFAQFERAALAASTLENRCYLMRSLFRLHLGGVDEVAETGTLVHLSFDKSTSTDDLVKLFPSSAKVVIRWINAESAFASVANMAEAEAVAAVGAAGQPVTARTIASYMSAEPPKECGAESESRSLNMEAHDGGGARPGSAPSTSQSPTHIRWNDANGEPFPAADEAGKPESPVTKAAVDSSRASRKRPRAGAAEEAAGRGDHGDS